MESPTGRKAAGLLRHSIARLLIFLGAWYLVTTPLGLTDWRTFAGGFNLAVAYGACSWLLAVRRARPGREPATRRRRVVVALAGLAGFVGLLMLVNTLIPRATPPAGASTPPHMQHSGPLPVIQGPSGVSRVEPRFGRAASIIAGIGTEVRCWSVEDWQKREAEWGNWHGRSLGPWGAYTAPWGPELPRASRIHLSPSICATLARLAYDPVPAHQDPWPEVLAFSVAALAHEAQHVSGELDEATAECHGMQSINEATQALGRTISEGRYLASLYWKTTYQAHGDSAYRSEECRNGGRLDLNPESDRWP
jgi:hypothetical protein